MDTQSNFSFVRNDLYIDHRLILSMMRSRFKKIDFYEEDVLNYCQEAEAIIGDVDMMVKFIEIPMVVENFTKGLMPCNVYRLMDVYVNPKDDRSRVQTTRNEDGRYLFFSPELRLRRVYLNYVGNPVNKDGMPLIVRSHQQAVLYYCLSQSLMEKVASGEFDPNIWREFNEKYPYMMAESQGKLRGKTRDHINHLDIIRGNMIPKIGVLSLMNTMFK